MGLFGKKNKEDFEDEEEIVDEENFRSRKIRDLKPENKKKRVEPPKPWGKKERYIVLGVFLFTILVAGFLAIYARDFKLPGLPRLSLNFDKSLINFNIFKNEPIIIGGNYQKQKDKEQKIVSEFENMTNNLSGTYALYVVDLSNDYSFGVFETKEMEAASLIKLPTIAALYKAVENETLSLDDKYTLKNTDKRGGSGSLSAKPAGTVLSYRDLARLMGKESDNTAFNIVRQTLGDEEIEDVAKSLGMSQTSVSDNSTTARDVGVFFQKLWNSEIVESLESKEEIMGYLMDTIYEEWLPKGIPSDVKVVHKYGREIRVVNDGGIVLSDSPFIVVLVSKGVIDSEADEIFPELSKMIYEAMVE